MSHIKIRSARHATTTAYSQSKNVVRGFFALATVTVATLAWTTGPAKAVDQPEAFQANSVTSFQIKDNDVRSSDLLDGGINQRDLSVPLYNLLRTPKAGSVGTWNTANGAMTEDKLSAGVRAKLNTPDSDVFGTASEANDFASKTITDVGGSFGKFTATVRATKLGDFQLAPGTYLLNSQFRADRVVAGAPGLRPQLALRVDNGTDWGLDFGTVMGTELSPTANRELYGSGFKVVTVTENTLVQVFGFGYNDDASAAGSGEIKMSASVVAVRVG